jgi:ribosome biogenesis protein SSF1/2
MARKKKSKKGLQGKEEPETLKRSPHTFVIKRGQVGKNVGELMFDFRKIMEPYTAGSLKISKKNVVRDFVSVASVMNVTHLVVFTKTEKASYMRVCRLPKGPTLTYKIDDYTLARDVRSSLKKPLLYAGLFQLAPLIVMNAFSGGDSLEVKLMASMWRNIFPSIDINNANLNAIRRCLMLNYNPVTKLIDLRHYAIKVKPVGLSRAVRRLVTSKKIPDLGKFTEIDEVMAREAALTESEGEADELDENRQVTLSQRISSRGNMIDEKSAIRLTEIGPRMTLELVKIEEGLMTGDILYHALVTKTKAEVKELKKNRKEKMKLKYIRKRTQEANVARKRASSSDNQGEERKSRGAGTAYKRPRTNTYKRTAN